MARARKWGFEYLNAYLPKSLKVKLNRLMPQARERVFADAFTADVDWSQTRAYSYYWETDPYVNLDRPRPRRHRQPQRGVRRGPRLRRSSSCWPRAT